MLYIPRSATAYVQKATVNFPAILLTGPRQCGKTTLLKHAFSRANYVLLEDPDIIGRVTSDPRGFLDQLRTPVILDEIQNAPTLLAYIRTVIDSSPDRKGQWLLTSSQEAPLMKGVSESMAGRVAILHLFPLSIGESNRVSILHGGYPDVVTQPEVADIWFRSYMQTYLERDVRSITMIKDLSTFRRFMAVLASRHGSILNKTDIAAPLGVSVPTITAWLNVLEMTGQILSVPPFFENFGKRLIKSPRLYFADSGMACHLLGIDNIATLERSPFLGALFEGFVAAEIVKQQTNAGKRKALYYFRDQQGLEIDFIVPQGDGVLLLVEVKATSTPVPSMALPLTRLTKTITRYQTQSVLVHRGTSATTAGHTIAPGVRATSLLNLLNLI